MVDVRLLDRLRTLAARKRWLIGLVTSAHCRRLRLALVGTEGRGLAMRAEVFANFDVPVPVDSQRLYCRLRRGQAPARDISRLAAQMAECQAALLDEMAAIIAPVWDRIVAVSVLDPGLWHRAAGRNTRVGLCDSVRLAELSGQNVIDALAERDLAQDGGGRPLMPIPYWILLHDSIRPRLLIEARRQTVRLTYLPPARDGTGANRCGFAQIRINRPESNESQAVSAIAEAIAVTFPPLAAMTELILDSTSWDGPPIEAALAATFSPWRIIKADQLGILPGALRAAGTAILGGLHLDQTPANIPALTGARTSRVLGRLTPGSLTNWHRLVRQLADARPSVVSLRSAI